MHNNAAGYSGPVTYRVAVISSCLHVVGVFGHLFLLWPSLPQLPHPTYTIIWTSMVLWLQFILKFLDFEQFFKQLENK